MKKYIVIVELIKNEHTKTTKAVTVEAGNKKIAVIRALKIFGESEGSEVYKTVKSVEEVA